MAGWTTINISKDTRDKLKALGKKSEKYDDIIIRLIDLMPKGDNHV